MSLSVDTEACTNDANCVSSELHDEKKEDLVTPQASSGRPKYFPMSTVSRQFDTAGKGYLDDTELALRRLDSQNLGHLTNDKVYLIMSSLQKEQKQSAELLGTLHRQQRQMIQMKHGIFALMVFSILLALSNVGTSFAAAKLAREVEVSGGNRDLIDLRSGQRVGVTPKLPNVEMQPLSSTRRRHLQSMELTLCNLMIGNETEAAGCSIVGTLSYNDMVSLHSQFCNDWSPTLGGSNGCSGGGVDKVRLTCNGRISDIYDHGLDSFGPVVDVNHPTYPDTKTVVFPHPGRGYDGTQFIFPSVRRSSSRFSSSAAACTQSFLVGMYCNMDDSEECFVLSVVAPGTGACFGNEYVKLCGEPDITYTA